MSTVQYILRQLAKKYCPSHVHCNIFYASVVFLSGLIVGALLILRLCQSLCFPLVYLSDILSFGFCCLFFLFLVVHHHELLVLVFFLIYIISLITYQKKENSYKISSSKIYYSYPLDDPTSQKYRLPCHWNTHTIEDRAF